MATNPASDRSWAEGALPVLSHSRVIWRTLGGVGAASCATAMEPPATARHIPSRMGLILMSEPPLSAQRSQAIAEVGRGGMGERVSAELAECYAGDGWV